ncbi:Histone chaperone asf1, partial [Dictyocoela roeselum]
MVLTLNTIKPDSFQKHLLDPLTFTLTLDNTNQIDSDIEFTIIYTGDPENDEHDQIVCEELVGPIPVGKVGFQLETSIVDFDKIPVDSLFGVTSIILEGKYRGQQFLRVGYFVNVSYPGESGLGFEEDEGDEVGSDEYSIDVTEHDEYEVSDEVDLEGDEVDLVGDEVDLEGDEVDEAENLKDDEYENLEGDEVDLEGDEAVNLKDDEVENLEVDEDENLEGDEDENLEGDEYDNSEREVRKENEDGEKDNEEKEGGC